MSFELHFSMWVSHCTSPLFPLFLSACWCGSLHLYAGFIVLKIWTSSRIYAQDLPLKIQRCKTVLWVYLCSLFWKKTLYVLNFVVFYINSWNLSKLNDFSSHPANRAADLKKLSWVGQGNIYGSRSAQGEQGVLSFSSGLRVRNRELLQLCFSLCPLPS